MYSRSIIEKLGNDRISKIKIVGKEEVEESFYGQLVLGKGVFSSLEEQLAREARKAGKFIHGQHDLSKNLAVFF